jgi:ABC-type Fe3+/spermidine/putrescine transport system ATPase subunit
LFARGAYDVQRVKMPPIIPGELMRQGVMASSAISIDTLMKTFPAPRSGDEFVVLHGISLTVEEGKFVSIVGPSGCGKSTLLNIIAGIEVV